MTHLYSPLSLDVLRLILTPSLCLHRDKKKSPSPGIFSIVCVSFAGSLHRSGKGLSEFSSLEARSREGRGYLLTYFIHHSREKIEGFTYHIAVLGRVSSEEDIDDSLSRHERIENAAIILRAYEDIMMIEYLYDLRVVRSRDGKFITYVLSRKITIIKKVSDNLHEWHASN